MRTNHGQIGHNSGQIDPQEIFYDLTTKPGALAYARRRARELVNMLAARKHNGNKDTAVYELTRHYNFRSWLGDLTKDSREPTLHFHFMERLERAFEREIIEQEKRIQHAKMLRRARHSRAANANDMGLVEEPGSGLSGPFGNHAGAL